MALEEEQIRARIREARKTSGLTQEEAADLHHVHKRTWENWENKYVPWDQLDDIAKRLGTTPEWLLHGDDYVPAPELRDLIRQVVAEERSGLMDEIKKFREVLERVEARLGDDEQTPG